MVENIVLEKYLNTLLNVNSFHDYAPNGIQIEGQKHIRRLVCGVTASQHLIESAINHKADAILVHHGYFWKGESAVLVGMKQRRIKSLLEYGINLFAYHLPLDAHPTLGNNACLAQRLGMHSESVMDEQGIGNVGYLNEPSTLEHFSEYVTQQLGRSPLVIKGGEHAVSRVAWCTGGAQKYLTKAAEMGADTYISGEVSENTYHEALELGVHYIAAGHHATERYGVQALGRHVQEQFDIEYHYVELENPV